MPDHFASGEPSGDIHTFVALGAMAASTTTIRLATGYANNLLRSPVEFAQAAMSMQAISGGRFEAGFGAGWYEPEIRGSGLHYPIPAERAKRFKEAVTVIRGLFAGDCDFSGEFYNVNLPRVGPIVEPPRLAAALGGPWTIANIGPLVDHIEVLPAGATLRDGDFNIGAYAKNVKDDDVRRMISSAREANPDATIGMSLFVAAAASPMTDFMASRFNGSLFDGLAGDPPTVVDAVRRFNHYDIDRITLTPPVPGTIEAISALIDD
jgi:alkanesulfonate monooxygenase SsuD/methylene tetrahydromethanopterin reductase-like flavin-dependent oxidoreductase (luciferase family)